jgi:hypothetical protein
MEIIHPKQKERAEMDISSPPQKIQNAPTNARGTQHTRTHTRAIETVKLDEIISGQEYHHHHQAAGAYTGG